MSKIHELAELGQAVWLDYMRRSLITSGELRSLIDAGLRGMTSNPTIFEKAISGGEEYEDDLRRLVQAGKSNDEIYEALALDDIGRAANMLRPVYEALGGGDGFVSLEVSPRLANDTAGTIAEAKRLFTKLDRPNVMIKIPATPAGIPAIEASIASGVNINITLIFSLAQYEAVVEAYLTGLEKLAASGGELKHVASVASFFVSRVDTVVDKILDGQGRSDLAGKAAIANAKVAYARFKELFSGPRYTALAAKGAQLQRPLWASTGTKDARFSDTHYIDTLIGPHTINTVPPATLEAFRDHGTVALTLEQNLDEARALLAELPALGVDLEAITNQLQVDGVAAFVKSFDALMASVAEKRGEVAV
jgi:transaldolase